jgi:hypothetical protein
LGAYRIPPETGILIPSDFNSQEAHFADGPSLRLLLRYCSFA